MRDLEHIVQQIAESAPPAPDWDRIAEHQLAAERADRERLGRQRTLLIAAIFVLIAGFVSLLPSTEPDSVQVDPLQQSSPSTAVDPTLGITSETVALHAQLCMVRDIRRLSNAATIQPPDPDDELPGFSDTAQETTLLNVQHGALDAVLQLPGAESLQSLPAWQDEVSAIVALNAVETQGPERSAAIGAARAAMIDDELVVTASATCEVSALIEEAIGDRLTDEAVRQIAVCAKLERTQHALGVLAGNAAEVTSDDPWWSVATSAVIDIGDEVGDLTNEMAGLIADAQFGADRAAELRRATTELDRRMNELNSRCP